MTFERVNVCTANIQIGSGVECLDDSLKMCIKFSDATAEIPEKVYIPLPNDSQKMLDERTRVLRKFIKFTGKKVAVMFYPNGYVRAISAVGSGKWLDLHDNYETKKFEEFNIVVTDLFVY